VLRKRPSDPDALYFLGLVHFHRGEHGPASDCVRRSLELAPNNPRAWNDLGGILLASGRASEARDAYRRSTEVAPQAAEGWYNFAVCLRNEDDIDGAVRALREAVAREPDYFRAYDALATVLYQLGRKNEAAEIYAQWHARDPDDPKARHMAAATSGDEAPSRAPDDYVQTLFDPFAASFDVNLAQLGYRAPELAAAGLARWTTRSPLPAVLDAGCGTGLGGPLLRPLATTLVGLDLSERMIERARARGCYDELVVAELTTFMTTRHDAFDAIVCVDTLVYFGALEEPMSAARAALRNSGFLIFTVEAPASQDNVDHRLEFHGRYTHSEAYVRRVLSATGFEVQSLSREVLRQERLEQVNGYLVIARSG
jgi:predicted TPR repeat methyltransferase